MLVPPILIPFMAACGGWHMGVMALLAHSCCSSGNTWSRVCCKPLQGLRDGGDISLHLELKLKAFLENSLQTVYHNTIWKDTSIWAHKKKWGNVDGSVEIYLLDKFRDVSFLKAPTLRSWGYVLAVLCVVDWSVCSARRSVQGGWGRAPASRAWWNV